MPLLFIVSFRFMPVLSSHPYQAIPFLLKRHVLKISVIRFSVFSFLATKGEASKLRLSN
jgi:hypothetical protein